MSMSLPSPGNEKIKTLGMPAAHANAKHAWNRTYEYNIQAACIYSTHTCVYHMCPCGVVSVTSTATTRLSPSPAPNCPGSILVAVGVQLHSAPRGGATFPNGAMGFRDFAKHLKKCRKYTSWKKNERNMHHGCHQQCNAMLTFNVWSTNAGRGFFKPIANEKMQVKPNLKYMVFFFLKLKPKIQQLFQ